MGYLGVCIVVFDLKKDEVDYSIWVLMYFFDWWLLVTITKLSTLH